MENTLWDRRWALRRRHDNKESMVKLSMVANDSKGHTHVLSGMRLMPMDGPTDILSKDATPTDSAVNRLPTFYRPTQWVERSMTEPFYQDDCG